MTHTDTDDWVEDIDDGSVVYAPTASGWVHERLPGGVTAEYEYLLPLPPGDWDMTRAAEALEIVDRILPRAAGSTDRVIWLARVGEDDSQLYGGHPPRLYRLDRAWLAAVGDGGDDNDPVAA